jgi:hypothetical protein
VGVGPVLGERWRYIIMGLSADIYLVGILADFRAGEVAGIYKKIGFICLAWVFIFLSWISFFR